MRIGNCRHCVAGERGGDMQSGGLSCHYWTHRTPDAADNWVKIRDGCLSLQPLSSVTHCLPLNLIFLVLDVM